MTKGRALFATNVHAGSVPSKLRPTHKRLRKREVSLSLHTHSTPPPLFHMKIFGLTPTQVLERSGAENIKRPYTLTFSILYGGIGFGVVSVIAYSIWAFRLIRGQGPMYASIALVYLLLSGWVLSRLTLGPKNQIRFTALFAVAFLGYAVLWCLFWFGLKGQHHGDLYGSAGPPSNGNYSERGFWQPREFIVCIRNLVHIPHVGVLYRR